MAYRILYKRSVQRDLKRLAKAEARRILDRLEEDLSKNPESYPLLKGEFTGLRKYRLGDYRIIFTLLDADVTILRVGHRRDVYK